MVMHPRFGSEAVLIALPTPFLRRVCLSNYTLTEEHGWQPQECPARGCVLIACSRSITNLKYDFVFIIMLRYLTYLHLDW